MKQNEVIKNITDLGKRILPQGSSLWLYGSRARGDARPGSDYDLLILLNKEQISSSDYDNYVYPLTVLGDTVGEKINTHLYSSKDWKKWWLSPFYENVESDKQVLI